MRRSTTICIAALFGVAAAAPALAQEVQTQSRVVYFGDLNLDNPYGAHRLVRRIEHASAQVCADDGSRQLTDRAETMGCRADAEQTAIADVDHPLVTAEYYGRDLGTVTVTEDDQQNGRDDKGH